MKDIIQSDGYKSLRAAVDKDHEQEKRWNRKTPAHDYEAKFNWTIERAKHYGEALDLDPADILDAWEAGRNYWYMNYYQDANQPKVEAGKVRVFDTIEDLKTSINGQGFRCPACGGVSTDAYTCDSGVKRNGSICDWKSYGLFGTMGKGAFVYVKEKLAGQSVFMPIAWEDAPSDDPKTGEAA